MLRHWLVCRCGRRCCAATRNALRSLWLLWMHSGIFASPAPRAGDCQGIGNRASALGGAARAQGARGAGPADRAPGRRVARGLHLLRLLREHQRPGALQPRVSSVSVSCMAACWCCTTYCISALWLFWVARSRLRKSANRLPAFNFAELTCALKLKRICMACCHHCASQPSAGCHVRHCTWPVETAAACCR